MNHIEEYGPYDGIMGFSMGGAICHLLSELMKEKLRNNEQIPIKFVVF